MRCLFGGMKLRLASNSLSLRMTLNPNPLAFLHSSAGITGVRHQASPDLLFLQEADSSGWTSYWGVAKEVMLSKVVLCGERSHKGSEVLSRAQLHPGAAPMSDPRGCEPLQTALLTEGSRESPPQGHGARCPSSRYLCWHVPLAPS